MRAFQFQTGAIKRYCSLKEYRYAPCFNSKLVRLKATAELMERGRHARFNSKLVRLKVKKRFLDKQLRRSFNSKLVRLKANSQMEDLNGDMRVSIPNWCD